MKRVTFHIGAPKSGTTYLQQILWANRESLAADGVAYPLNEPKGFLGPSVDLCQRAWGGRENPAWVGAWDRLATRIRDWTGDRAVYSAELMGLATPAQARRAIESVQPAEVHLIVTSRDLARQIPSEWQEQVKHRHTVPYNTFVDDLVNLGFKAPAPFGELFWGLHDPVYVLDRWAAVVPPDRVHVVIVPQVFLDDDGLWESFAGAAGIDGKRYEVDVSTYNTSMGVAETEFIRRFNVANVGKLSHEVGPAINRLLAQDILAQNDAAGRLELPPKHREWAHQRGLEMRAGLVERGFDLIGDPDALIPSLLPDPEATEASTRPESLLPRAINAVAYRAVAGLLEEVVSLRGRARRLADWIEEREPGALAEIENGPGD